MSVGIGSELPQNESYGNIEVTSKEVFLSVDVSEQELQTLIGARLSTRQFLLELRVLGVSDRTFDDANLAPTWRVRSYAMSIFEAPHPPAPSPQGGGGEES